LRHWTGLRAFSPGNAIWSARDLYQTPGVADTVNMDHIKRHYYMSMTAINPTRIVPLGPELNFSAPHDRGRFARQ
jgi:putative glutathione S-transferase